MTAATAALTTASATLAGCSAPAAEPPRVDAEVDPDLDPGETVALGFGGDVMLGRNLDERYADVVPAGPWTDLLDRLDALDGLFVNLECCLSTRGERFPDRAYYFRADPAWAVPALERAGVRWAALANNHALDYGPTALRDTLDALGGSDVATAGAGETLDESLTPSVVRVGGLEVAAFSIADHFAEYGATRDAPGIAYAEADPTVGGVLDRVGTALARARAADPDLIVASIHWGPNWVAYPDERYVRFARWLIDRGVAVVHGHSAHVFQGVETYGDGVIVHDAGDLLDDYAVDETLRNDRSFLFELVVGADGLEELRLHPVVIDDLAVGPAGPEAAAWARETMRERSAPFGTADAFERAEDGNGLVLPL
ncbi:CapA family protein [Salinilacihabitans rarus]|uniref:CapA family protein n=1 Tax=Salinilacihabitans rarus TaxID=2961596 RepID=UPI0020C83F8E|nr:CapA family protein [Salinilacihabitans rarus]